MTRRERILREMGLAPLWRLRDKPAEKLTDEPAVDVSLDSPAPPPALPSALAEGASLAPDSRMQRIAALGWDELTAAVSGCRDCRLCERRKKTVFGVGDIAADWLFIGEGPGAEEDESGEPFVGQAGRLLDAMLAAINLKRGDNVYIGNVVKCRPPGNRTPEPEETAACFPYLRRQIGLIRPRLIVALGKPAAETLLDAEVRVGAARGRLFEHGGIPLIVTYHPAYLLRNLTDKTKAWEDLCFARRVMKERQDAGG
ncbi:MAG: uracil-DNA glycosylase [Zoogloeaceae bacterium]|nr:uracil-DNA glycosylase [Zoogloeaceae bacterium]